MVDLIQSITDSICPGSVHHATQATKAILRSGLNTQNDELCELAIRLCAAKHSYLPKLERKKVLVLAADHGVAFSGVDLGPDNPTFRALTSLSKGEAAIHAALRSTESELVLVDMGILGGDQFDVGQSILSFRCGNQSRDFRTGPAMTMAETVSSIQTGIALTFSLADTGLDILGLGHMAIGAEPSSVAIVSEILGCPPEELSRQDFDVVIKGLERTGHKDWSPLELLSEFGSYEIAGMVGAILAASSIQVPVVLDGHGTSAAALLAVQMKAEVRSYLFASHQGGIAAHKRALEQVGISPLFSVGLAQGEGTGAVLAFPMFDAAIAALAHC